MERVFLLATVSANPWSPNQFPPCGTQPLGSAADFAALNLAAAVAWHEMLLKVLPFFEFRPCTASHKDKQMHQRNCCYRK